MKASVQFHRHVATTYVTSVLNIDRHLLPQRGDSLVGMGVSRSAHERQGLLRHGYLYPQPLACGAHKLTDDDEVASFPHCFSEMRSELIRKSCVLDRQGLVALGLKQTVPSSNLHERVQVTLDQKAVSCSGTRSRPALGGEAGSARCGARAVSGNTFLSGPPVALQ